MSSRARPGKPRREEQDLLPCTQQALVLKADSANWTQCDEAVGTSAANPRKWRKHPDADGFLQKAIRSSLEQAHTCWPMLHRD
ncbi:MAG: hypothetical protein VYE46_04230 [Cyanobacteriota bacterium]|nr:hypothetical protein [Cyanobacteriota bacterium]